MTSDRGVSTHDSINNARQHMITAFAELSALARQAGVDHDAITDLHGRFFDGNEEIKASVRALWLLVEIYRPTRDEVLRHAPLSPAEHLALVEAVAVYATQRDADMATVSTLNALVARLDPDPHHGTPPYKPF